MYMWIIRGPLSVSVLVITVYRRLISFIVQFILLLAVNSLSYLLDVGVCVMFYLLHI